MTSSHRPALGRGLSALIPTTPSDGGAALDLVDIDLITPNPHPNLPSRQAGLVR